MNKILTKIGQSYNYLFVELADPRVKELFLISSPWPLFFILVLYLYFIFKWGPKFMQNRRPYTFDRILVVYNLIQIIACCYLFLQYTLYVLFTCNLFCEPIDYSNSESALHIAKHVWYYFLLKLLDLLDTVFFILRKKNGQVSFLHVYHHTGMCLLAWVGTKYVAGGHGIFVGFMNTFVHIFMYIYYLLSAWDKEYKKECLVEKYITQLQITQFVLISLHFGQVLFQPNCGYPRWIALALLPQNIFMIALFTNFYINAYVKTKQNNEVKLNGISKKAQ